jgi:hypothetical protein
MTSITQLTALVLGAALSISVAAEPWNCDFSKDLDSRYWTPTIVGNSTFTYTTTANGLQVAGPDGGSGFQSARLLLNLDNFPGGLTDFEAVVTFEGAVFNDSWRHQVQLEFSFPSPNQYIAVVKSQSDIHVWRDPPASEANNTSTGANAGTIRVVRSGPTIAAYWNDGATPFWSQNYGTSPLTYFSLALNKNSSSVATAVTWKTYSITPAPIIASPVIISGVVRHADGMPVANVLVRAEGGLTTNTAADGTYALTVPSGWSGTLTPQAAGWVFNPANRAYVNLNAGVATGDFSMTLAEAAVLSLTRSATILQFAWPSAMGLRYQLQSSLNLLPGSWTNEGEPTDGTGSPLSASLLIGPELAKFFRLKID